MQQIHEWERKLISIYARLAGTELSSPREGNGPIDEFEIFKAYFHRYRKCRNVQLPAFKIRSLEISR